MATNFSITRGLPFARSFRIVDGKNVWPTLPDFEVRSQLRTTKAPTSTIIENLHDFMEASYDVDDILIAWSMTGAETLTLASGGYYDIVVSDAGASDERAISISSGKIKVSDTTTKPEGET